MSKNGTEESAEREGTLSRPRARARGKRKRPLTRVAHNSAKVKDAVSALAVPEDVLKHSAVLTIVGHQAVTVENHGGILAYDTDCIRLRVGKESVCVAGSRLVIDYYNDEELKIVGAVSRVFWENEGGDSAGSAGKGGKR